MFKIWLFLNSQKRQLLKIHLPNNYLSHPIKFIRIHDFLDFLIVYSAPNVHNLFNEYTTVFIYLVLWGPYIFQHILW